MRRIKIGGLTRKDPQADEPFFIDWSDRLGTGVGIDTSTWDVQPSGLGDHDPAIGTLTGDVFATSASGQVTKVHLDGGTLHDLHTVTNSIVTDETPPRELDGSFSVLIQQE
jgi:hypothetical protein